MMFRFAALLLVASACSSAPSQPASREAASPDLLGKWRITALDGRAPVAGRDGRSPVITFDENGYGGYAGCNGFGGQGLAHEGRFYGGFAMSTAMACGQPFDGQEAAVQRLLAGAPRVQWRGADRLALVAPDQRLELERTGPLPRDRSVTPAIPLIGTAWSFGALDGRPIEMPGARSGPTLTVEGDRFTLETPCLTMKGSWTQTGPGAVTLRPERSISRTCNPISRGQSEAWSQAMRGALRYSNGPNGEMLLAGGGHWMVGDLVRRGSSEAAALAGRYEVEGGPAPAQREGAKAAELILTRNAYYLWDGCNRTEGLAIPFERQLFLHGSGLTTLANCLPGRDDAHFKRMVLAEPRIGRIPGGLLLSSPAGAIRLRRTGDVPPGTGGVTTRLLPGMRFTLLDEGGGTLAILPGSRFRLTQPCGVTQGRWRAAPGEPDGAVRFGPDRPAEACERESAARPLQRAFLGNVDVAIGPNRDIALFAGRFGAVRARLER
ncbi:META domain-containing protein [Sphingosinicella rhizophila]|uniref:META domain-containing protein n=1 Tax=Sphingosinicella rhizophila TaxID=3050082 RepID=A0ABU3QA22_9SPHN|nr:META domain-containing protein [Sphingosinicella sp. GR2756]MDT9600258.1 META domain-containing protein [Sphingosinicella sp. GR2756]